MDRALICVFTVLFVASNANSNQISVVTQAFENHGKQSIWLLYCKLNKKVIKQDYLAFEVKACREARIILAENYDTLRPSSEVILGKATWLSRIRTCTGYPCEDENLQDTETGEVLDCQSFQPFWISWSGDILSVGKGLLVGENEMFFHRLSNTVNHVGLQTISSNTDEWIVYKDNIDFDMSNDENCVAVYNLSQTPRTSTYINRITTDIVSPTATTNSCNCKCTNRSVNPWGYLSSMNLSIDETKLILKDRLNQLKTDIKVNPRHTKRYNTTKTSARDDRLSATVAGWIGGCIIALVPALVVITDIINYCL